MTGIGLAVSIILAWIFSVFWALTQIRIAGTSALLSHLSTIIWIQFLSCGLFITAHDACHGTAAPGRPRVNLWLGRIAAFLYAGFIFDSMAPKHAAHHRSPGQKEDPDFHSNVPGREGFHWWIARFFSHYLSVGQLLFMTGVSQVLMHGFHLPEVNVLGFWVLPSVLSAVQLFYFGTYLPHRRHADLPFPDRHHTRNSAQSYLVSLWACFHFGAYHHRHHLEPSVPWFKLPKKRAPSRV